MLKSYFKVSLQWIDPTHFTTPLKHENNIFFKKQKSCILLYEFIYINANVNFSLIVLQIVLFHICTYVLLHFFFRWNDLKRKVDLWTEIQELNDQGVFAPVEINSRSDNSTGGIFQLRQGQSRRIVVGVRPLPKSGSLPVVIETISAVKVGSVCRRDKNEDSLDSYQERDLSVYVRFLHH